VEMPGGGGYGDPMTRDADAVADDVRAGFIDTATAEKDYGVIVSEDFTVDAVRTAVRRQAAGD
ncbi:MAG: hydantoinase B/oxoprolinase family protein, partial [Pseudomonadota bacterium]|nr:hydantoinase B/oxoprolinase family protein [Pseudomonadota bacterium]